MDALRKLSPDTVYAAITMNPTPAHTQAVADANDIVKRGYAEFVGGRKIGSIPAGDPKAMPNQCSASSKVTDPSRSASWNGWGRTRRMRASRQRKPRASAPATCRTSN
jgi:hypothetical protein